MSHFAVHQKLIQYCKYSNKKKFFLKKEKHEVLKDPRL